MAEHLVQDWKIEDISSGHGEKKTISETGLQKLYPGHVHLIGRLLNNIFDSENNSAQITFKDGVSHKQEELQNLVDIIKEDFKTLGLSVEGEIHPMSMHGNQEVLIFLKD